MVRLSLHEDLPSVEREWRAFEQRADCTVFQSFTWLSAWHLHIGTRKGTRPAIVIGRDPAGVVLFLLPLAAEPLRFVRCLTWLGSETNDYNAPLLAANFPQALGALRFVSLWRDIVACIEARQNLRFDLVRFIRMPERVGSQRNPFLALPVTAHPSGAYLTHLGGDWESFYARSRSPATRKRDRRKRKRLEEKGAVRFVTPHAIEEVGRSFDLLVRLKARSFAAMGVRNMFRRPGHGEFYRSVAVDPATRAIAHVSRLDVGAVPVAVSLGLMFRGAYYLVLSSYDNGPGLARLSPGSAHLHELMRHAVDAGCDVFDFTVGDEPYKRDWSDNESALFDHVSAAHWPGALLALPLIGLTCLKRAIKRSPLLWGTFCKMRAFVRGRS